MANLTDKKGADWLRQNFPALQPFIDAGQAEERAEQALLFGDHKPSTAPPSAATPRPPRTSWLEASQGKEPDGDDDDR